MPFAAVVLRRLLRATGATRVVFSANGLREGWFAQRVAPETRDEPPLLAAGREMAARYGRSPALPPMLLAWTAPLFADETAEAFRLREAACWMSDIGSLDHPEYRAQQSFYRVLRQPGVALDHHARAFLALTLALRYEAEPDMGFLDVARQLLAFGSLRRAEILGTALRLAYTLSGGTPELLECTALAREGGRLVLKLQAGTGVFSGESVTRRLERLGEALGLEAVTQ
jgi:exopolyphosphatase/guanosine-5'-triphosphate,3'-diphosphate pyrophosphatase